MIWLTAVAIPLIVVPLGAWVNHVFKKFDAENTRQHDVNKSVLDQALATANRTESAVHEVWTLSVRTDQRLTDHLENHEHHSD